jgi:hypothetical protein
MQTILFVIGLLGWVFGVTAFVLLLAWVFEYKFASRR